MQASLTPALLQTKTVPSESMMASAARTRCPRRADRSCPCKPLPDPSRPSRSPGARASPFESQDIPQRNLPELRAASRPRRGPPIRAAVPGTGEFQRQAAKQIEIDEPAADPIARRDHTDHASQVLAPRTPGAVQGLGTRCRYLIVPSIEPLDQASRHSDRSKTAAAGEHGQRGDPGAQLGGNRVGMQVDVQADADDHSPRSVRGLAGKAPGAAGAARARPGCRRPCGPRRGHHWAT